MHCACAVGPTLAIHLGAPDCASKGNEMRDATLAAVTNATITKNFRTLHPGYSFNVFHIVTDRQQNVKVVGVVACAPKRAPGWQIIVGCQCREGAHFDAHPTHTTEQLFVECLISMGLALIFSDSQL